MVWPRMFRDPFRLSIPACSLDLGWGGGYQLGFSGCTLENTDLSVLADARFTRDEGKPEVDINAVVTRATLDRLDPYWPEAILKDSVKTWLRRGLVAGDVTGARFQIRGDMDDWPFREGQGRFEAIARIGNGRLDYLDRWPDAEQFEASVRFLGPSMVLDGSVGNIGGVAAEAVSASIDDLKTPVLKVNYSADTVLPKLLGFFESTPLQELIKVDLSQFTFAGPVHTTGLLTVPLGSSAGELSLDGRLRMSKGYFSDPVSETVLENIAGELSYDETGFSGEGLDALFHDSPARLDIAAGTGREEKFRADLQGVFRVRDVVPSFLQENYAELVKFEGECPWKASLVVASGDDPDNSRTVLTV
jgi:uncharacterized protein YhdP